MKTKSKDGKKHLVQIYVGASSAIASNKGNEEMIATGYTTQNLNVLKLGTVEQPILQKSGDDLRIDWGYAYIAANKYTLNKYSSWDFLSEFFKLDISIARKMVEHIDFFMCNNDIYFGLEEQNNLMIKII